MPAPREQPNPNRNRKRQDTMPGGWLWVVIMLLVGVVLYITFGMSGFSTIDYSDFEKLVAEDQIAKVTFKEGSSSLVAEIKNPDKLEEPLKKQIRGNRVEVLLWKGDVDSGEVTKLLKSKNIPRRTEGELKVPLGSYLSLLVMLLILAAFFF